MILKDNLVVFRVEGLNKVKKSLYRPEQALRVPGGWGSQMSRHSAHEGGKIVSPKAPAAFTFQYIFLVFISVRWWIDPQCHNAVGRIKSMKNSNNTIGNRTRNLPGCRINLMNLSLQDWILNIVAPDIGTCLNSLDNKETVNVNKGPTRCNSMQTFILCHVTLHVSGVMHPSSGVLKTVSATSGVRHGNGTGIHQRWQIQFLVLLMTGAWHPKHVEWRGRE